MPFNYVTNLAKVVTLLQDHNTTTATPDLSVNLTRRLNNDNVREGDPETESIKSRELPAVWVRIDSKAEEPASIGQTGPTRTRKFADVNYEIFGLYLREGLHTKDAAHRTEIYNLASNIEGVFQQEFNLDNTALWAHPDTTEFQTFQSEGEAVKGVLMNLSARHLFR